MNPTLSYMSAYPDVWKNYQKNSYGMTPNQYAQAHYNQYGPREQRRSPEQVANYFQGGGVPDWFQQASMNWKTNQPTNEMGVHSNWQQYNTPGFRGINPSQMQDFRTAYEKIARSGPYGGGMAGAPSMDHLQYMNDPDVRMAAMKQIGATPWKPQSSYLLNNPDVAAAYNKNSMGMTPQQYAQTHYQKFGQNEQRAAPPRSYAPNDSGWGMDYGPQEPPPIIRRGNEGVDGPAYIAVNNQKYYGDDQINKIQSMIANPPQYNTVNGPRQMSPDMAALFAKQQAEARPLEELLKAGRPA